MTRGQVNRIFPTVTPANRGKLATLLEHALVFAGDLLPYGVVFLLTLMVGYGLGLEAAAFLSLSYAYVAIVTALVCGPNLLSLRRRMPGAGSPGAVVFSALALRATVIAVGALLVIGGVQVSGARPGTASLMALLFVARLLETGVDGPATSVQYLRGARNYFLLRAMVFALICGATGVGVLTAGDAGLPWIALCYAAGSGAGFLVAMAWSRDLLRPVVGLAAECRAQAGEFGKFFLATALFLAASRLHPMIIAYFSGHEVAGQFAMVQNLFSALALAATGVAGVFFWSRNRQAAGGAVAGVPWRWMLWSLPGGLAMGALGGVVMDLLFLRPLGSPDELRLAAWILCLSTPFLLPQAILSNQLVLLGRDREMLGYSALNAAVGVLLIALLVLAFGLVGAALSVGASALLSTLLGIRLLRRSHE